ncbi:MAG: hypothetical protein A6F72_02960 [Cycloclasticus sp. symbiont of Poecilosclerida sp. N]|nr:MAG: hypothetical protein A6F72_02960 [Cycloclasticus sp. symbiont of Poecilosclerida sp. N]
MVQLLQQIGVEFETKVIDIDKTYLANEMPEGYVKPLAIGKAPQRVLSTQGVRFYRVRYDGC